MRFSIIIDQHDATDGIYLHIVPSPTSEWLDHAEEASTGFMVASVGGLSEGHRHGGPGVCLGDGQKEAYLKDMGMTGLASAWAMARRRPI